MPIPISSSSPAPVGTLDGRLRFPSTDDRLVYEAPGPNLPLYSRAGVKVKFYTDAGGSILADIVDNSGVAIPGSELTVNNDSQIPEFFGPVGVEVLYVRAANGAPYPIFAWLQGRYNDLNDEIASINDRVDGIITGSGFLTATDLQTFTDATVQRVDSLGLRSGLVGGVGQALATVLDNDFGSAVVALSGDSTGNADDEWFRRAITTIAADHPALKVNYNLWSDATQTYTNTVIQAGNQAEGILLSDSFNRTSADLKGSQAEIGGIWGGATNAAGDWTVSGGKAVRTADTTGAEQINSGGAGNHSLTLNGSISTQSTGTARSLRAYIKYLSSSDHIFFNLNISSTGITTWSVFKRIGGVSTTIATGPSNPLPANVAALAAVSISLSCTGNAVSATLNGSTISATLTDSDTVTLETATSAGFTGGMLGDEITDISLNVTPNANTVQQLTFYNGSHPGSILQYQQDRIATMLPVAPDLLILSSVHNYSSSTPTAYTTAVQAYVTAVRAVYPNTPVLASSQNVQFTPATNPNNHMLRMGALRTYALRNGWDYLPVSETYRARSDGGASLVQADGIHPNTDGSDVWRDVFLDYLTALSLKPLTV